MNVTIFGAAGRTGKHVVRRALDAGHTVTAYAHHPAKLEITHEQLNVVQGDIREKEKVAKAVEGADAVISVLGPKRNQEGHVISQGTRAIVDAMRTHGVGRLIVSMGAGVGDPRDQPGLIDRIIQLLLKLTARHVYEDMNRVADVVRSSDRAWTLVRAPMLTDDAGTGDVRVGYLGGDVGTQLSREDMAMFMVEQLEDQTYVHKAPVISS